MMRGEMAPVVGSCQTLTVPSRDPVAKWRPSGAQDMVQMIRACAFTLPSRSYCASPVSSNMKCSARDPGLSNYATRQYLPAHLARFTLHSRCRANWTAFWYCFHVIRHHTPCLNMRISYVRFCCCRVTSPTHSEIL